MKPRIAEAVAFSCVTAVLCLFLFGMRPEQKPVPFIMPVAIPISPADLASDGKLPPPLILPLPTTPEP